MIQKIVFYAQHFKTFNCFLVKVLLVSMSRCVCLSLLQDLIPVCLTTSNGVWHGIRSSSFLTSTTRTVLCVEDAEHTLKLFFAMPRPLDSDVNTLSLSKYQAIAQIVRDSMADKFQIYSFFLEYHDGYVNS